MNVKVDDLWAYERHLTAALRVKSEKEHRSRVLRERAGVRLRLQLFDAALADVAAAGGSDKAGEHRLAALAGLRHYGAVRAMLEHEGAASADVMEHVERLKQQGAGNYIFADVFRPTAPLPTSLMPRMAAFLGPVGVAELSGPSCRGLVALRDVQRGDLLLAEAALVRVAVPKGSASSEAIFAAAESACSRAAEISAHARRLLGALSDGSPRSAMPTEWLAWSGVSDEAYALGPSASLATLREASLRAAIPTRLRGVWSTNAFAGSTHLSLFAATALMNHSCISNAFVVPAGEALITRARRDIRAGEEVTISYFDPLRPVAERDREAQKWGFRCQCRRCNVERGVDLSFFYRKFCEHGTAPDRPEKAKELILELGALVAHVSLEESQWCLASYAELFQHDDGTDCKLGANQPLHEILNSVQAGSFLHCKVALEEWRRLACIDGEDVEEEAARFFEQLGMCMPDSCADSTAAEHAWDYLVDAHRLRYGEVTGSDLPWLLLKTANAKSEADEFCLNPADCLSV